MPTGEEWPFPFKGITSAVAFKDNGSMQMVLGYMAGGCERNHKHNLAVEFDRQIIHTTELGLECIARAQGNG